MYHTLILTGNLGGDPEMRYTDQGKPVTSFSLAVSDGFGERKRTLWFRISAWERVAENCNQHLKKGSKVLVEGRLIADGRGNPRIWERQDGSPAASFEVNATLVRFLSPKGDANGDGDGEETPLAADGKEEAIPF